jgi:hypothetical protein
MANVATIAGLAVEVVELLGYPQHWSEIAEWLTVHQAGNGPVLASITTPSSFLARPGDPAVHDRHRWRSVASDGLHAARSSCCRLVDCPASVR